MLEPLLADPAVTDVLVNGPGEVWVDRGDGLERVAVRFADEGAVRRLAVRLATSAGRRLDDAQPWVDARLAGGVRLHAVLPPIAAGGTCVSLRVPRPRVFDLAELVAAGAVPQDGAVLLGRLVAARVAFLVSGGTGTGKTTLLSALLSLADDGDRLLLVEDACELAPRHPHVVRLESRPANVEGAGAVTLRDLVRQALRMRPDRLVVGEVRGAEVVDLLAALNTGHEGGSGTLHANSAHDVPARLEALAAVAGMSRGRPCTASWPRGSGSSCTWCAPPAVAYGGWLSSACSSGARTDWSSRRPAWSWDGSPGRGGRRSPVGPRPRPAGPAKACWAGPLPGPPDAVTGRGRAPPVPGLDRGPPDGGARSDGRPAGRLSCCQECAAACSAGSGAAASRDGQCLERGARSLRATRHPAAGGEFLAGWGYRPFRGSTIGAELAPRWPSGGGQASELLAGFGLVAARSRRG